MLGGIPARTVTSDCRLVNGFLGLIVKKIQAAVLGHRGWPTRYPDNTLAGLIAAADVCDGVEVDIRRSMDGKLVLSHDPEILGHTVADTPWSVLAELDVGGGHHPVLLDEALAALAGVPAQLEVKNLPHEPGFEIDHRLALETADRARSGDLITGFNPETLAAVRRVFPDVETGLAVAAGTDLDQVVKYCLDAGHRALVPHYSLITRSLTTEVEIYPWTVNDPIKARELADLGITGIITDDPGLISETFENPS